MVALFTKRDSIAVAVISVLILVGWGIRYSFHAADAPDSLHLIRNAVPVPPEISSPEQSGPALIDINTAAASVLEKLPMIGPVKAQGIVTWRETHGPFRNIADIVNVPGIGTSTFASIRDLICVADTDSASGDKIPSPSTDKDTR